MFLRQELHAKGFRFRLHDVRLPGKPDLVLPRYRAVIFAHGCFWHGHDCHLFKWPASNQKFWENKIMLNRSNDEKTESALHASDWRVLKVWECALKGRRRRQADDLMGEIAEWLNGSASSRTITGIVDVEATK